MPYLTTLEVTGLRGCAERCTIPFAIPNGTPGSGLTILVGPNNGGKSTMIDALRYLAQREAASFSEGRRNKRAGDRVQLDLSSDDGSRRSLASVEAGSSETRWTTDRSNAGELFVVPSRRSFAPYFGAGEMNRSTYASYQVPALRVAALDAFPYRLRAIARDQDKRTSFDDLLAKVVVPRPRWTIDQSDTGQLYVKISVGDQSHNSEGVGEGILSLLFIVDALHDSLPGQAIAIDEPELSLHPALQKRLATQLSQYAADRQIIYATHSPYFVGWQDLAAGARLTRVAHEPGGVRAYSPPASVMAELFPLAQDLQNPHLLGINASEVFFLDDDRVVLVEWQEDVVVYRRVLQQLNMDLPAEFFGWGVGGAGKMTRIAMLLSSLGFQRVAGILDGDQAAAAATLRASFPGYRFEVIPAPDVRTKAARGATDAREGLTESDGTLRPEHVAAVTSMMGGLRDWFAASI